MSNFRDVAENRAADASVHGDSLRVGARDEHSNHICFTGHPLGAQRPPGGWPTFGAVISKMQGAQNPAMPPFVGLENKMKHRPYNAATPGFCGVAHKSFRPEGDGKSDMTLKGISLDRLKDRMGLLKSFDQFRRDVDAEGLMDGMDAFNQQAFGILTSSRWLRLWTTRRRILTIEMYGKGDKAIRGDAAPRILVNSSCASVGGGRCAGGDGGIQFLGLARQQLRQRSQGYADV